MLSANTNSKTELIDVDEVQINPSLPLATRIQSFVEEVKNPYHYRHGDMVVRVKYAENSPSLQNILKDYLVSKKTS